MIIAVVNNKGGVGKTTTAVNLAAALATPEHRVLLVDLDSLASASNWCGVPRRRLKPSAASCLLHDYPIEQAIRKTSVPYLDLIPGSLELVNTDLALGNVPGRELTLKELLEPLRRRYGTVILDCPPSLSLVGVNAMVAADGVIVPVTPQHLVVEGLPNVLRAVDSVRTRLGAKHDFCGILLNMLPRTPSAADVRRNIRARFREQVFETEIATSSALERAPAVNQPILTLAPRSPAAAAFRRLASEVVSRARNQVS